MDLPFPLCLEKKQLKHLEHSGKQPPADQGRCWAVEVSPSNPSKGSVSSSGNLSKVEVSWKLQDSGLATTLSAMHFSMKPLRSVVSLLSFSLVASAPSPMGWWQLACWGAWLGVTGCCARGHLLPRPISLGTGFCTPFRCQLWRTIPHVTSSLGHARNCNVNRTLVSQWWDTGANKNASGVASYSYNQAGYCRQSTNDHLGESMRCQQLPRQIVTHKCPPCTSGTLPNGKA